MTITFVQQRPFFTPSQDSMRFYGLRGSTPVVCAIAIDGLAVLNGGPILDTADAEQVFKTFRKRIEAKTQRASLRAGRICAAFSSRRPTSTDDGASDRSQAPARGAIRLNVAAARERLGADRRGAAARRMCCRDAS
jgi:hypothetical protein